MSARRVGRCGRVNASSPAPSDQPARFAVAWRPQGLYFYVEVDDPALLPAAPSDQGVWCGDALELYVDSDGRFGAAPNYDVPGAMQLLAAGPAESASAQAHADQRYASRDQPVVGAWSTSSHRVVKRAGGYALEAFVTASDLGLRSWTLARGAKVGIDLAVDVSVTAASDSAQADCGYRLGQYFLRTSSDPCAAESCRPYLNVNAFCTPSLQ